MLFGYGATATTFDHYVPSMILFGPGIVFFTVHYLMLRGFYALELNRTVFFIQCAIAATNVVVALLLVHGRPPAQTSPALVLAYGASYLLGVGDLLPACCGAGSAGWRPPRWCGSWCAC